MLKVLERWPFNYIMHILYNYDLQNCASLTWTYQLVWAPICTPEYYTAKQNKTLIKAALGFIHLC